MHCAELDNEIDPHVHKQTMTLSQMNTSLGYGLGAGWQLSAMVPFQVKDTTIDYVDMDGALLLRSDIARGVVITDDAEVILPETGGSGVVLTADL